MSFITIILQVICLTLVLVIPVWIDVAALQKLAVESWRSFRKCCGVSWMPFLTPNHYCHILSVQRSRWMLWMFNCKVLCRWQMFCGATRPAGRRRYAACHPAACVAADTWSQVRWNVCRLGRPEAASWTQPVATLPGLLFSCFTYPPTHSGGRPSTSPWHGKGDYTTSMYFVEFSQHQLLIMLSTNSTQLLIMLLLICDYCILLIDYVVLIRLLVLSA